MFTGLGSLGNANGMSAEQMIIQNSLLDMAEYQARGVDMDDYKLAFDSIKNAGPGGNFITDNLTLELLRSDEFFESPGFDLSGGYVENAPSMYEKAHQQVCEISENYIPDVPDKVKTAIKAFFKDKYQNPKVSDM